MPLSLKDPEVDRLARLLAKRTGKSMTAVIREALQDAVEREEQRRREKVERLMEIGRRSAALPLLDDRPEEEILGYDEMLRGD